MKSIIFLLFATLLFVGCEDSNEDYSYIEGDLKPSLEETMVYHFDENLTGANNKAIGKVYIDHEGGSKITDYELKGAGSSLFYIKDNLFYLKDGIASLDCENDYLYNLTLQAQNNYGKSNTAKVYMQVNCLKNPSLHDMHVYHYTPENNEFTIDFVRKGLGYTGSISSAGLYSLNNLAYLGTDFDGIHLRQGSQGWKIKLDCRGEEQKSHYLLRVVNDKNLRSPYVNLEIHRYRMDCPNYDNGGGNGDDYPNSLYDSNTPNFIADPSFSFSGNIDYMDDKDVIKFDTLSSGMIGVFNISASDTINLKFNQFVQYTVEGSGSVPVKISQQNNNIEISSPADHASYNVNFGNKSDNEDGLSINTQNTIYYGAIDNQTDYDTVYISYASGRVLIDAMDNNSTFEVLMFRQSGTVIDSNVGSHIELSLTTETSYITISSQTGIGVYSVEVIP